MRDMLRKSKSDNEAVITDDQYRESVSKNAIAILNSLFDSISMDIIEQNTLNILVIGAGMFPSFKPLLLSLQRISPNLKTVTLTIIEPLKSETDRFNNYVSRLDLSCFYITFEYSIHNVDIKEYLTNIKNVYFDIIYFEQPDLSPVGILLAKTGSFAAKLELSLRESIPFLKNIIQSKTIIVASFLFKRDLKQLNTLINYSLKIPTKIVYLSIFNSSGSPYSSGLISLIEPPALPNENPQKKASAIKKQDNYYAMLLLISTLLFVLTPSPGKLFSFLCTVTLLLHHRYGFGSFIIKSAIILTQIAILILVLYMT